MGAKRDTTRYTMRKGNTILKYGKTNNPERREPENQRDGIGGTLRKEGPKVTDESARNWEQRMIEQYTQRHGHPPPGNKQG